MAAGSMPSPAMPGQAGRMKHSGNLAQRDSLPGPGAHGLIEARAVDLSFGQTPALRGASVSVAAGEIVAIMGPSGSGKSTLLHCMGGILVPDAGEVWFGDRRVDTMTETERSELRREFFGFVFQFGQLVPELTAAENVALPLLLGGIRRSQALREAQDWLERLGLDGLEQRRSGELSGGQAQRIALARGMIAGPAVLFADEPTGSLDSQGGAQVLKLLVAAARERATAVVLVTHEPQVAAYADRRVVVRDGSVAAQPDSGARS
jgi:putative ABC transport system ATP-binding protein